MSSTEDPTEQIVDQPVSLSERMAARQDVLQKTTTEWFPIPGYEGVLEVELRALGYTTVRGIMKRNEKVREDATRELYTLADQMVMATEGFQEIVPGQPAKPLEGEDWISLARRLPNAPDQMTPRQAVLFLVGERRIVYLVTDWTTWGRSVATDVEAEVVSDFDMTG